MGLAQPPFDAWFPPPALSLAGTYVAFGEYETGSDGFAYEAVQVQNVAAPKARVLLLGVITNELGSVRVKSDGAVAWIGCYAGTEHPNKPGPQCMHPRRSKNSVMKLDASQEPHGGMPPAVPPTTLSTGRGIDPTSLRLAGSALSWRENGERRTARLN